MTLGWRMKMALGHDLTVQQMADELGMSRGQVSRYLNDKGIPKRAVLLAWALRSGVPFEWLAYGKMSQTPPPTGGSVTEERGSACTRSPQVIHLFGTPVDAHVTTQRRVA